MRLLLLAGTPEATQIARAVVQDPSVVATASLARAARAPLPLGLPTRIGGWGSDAAFRSWLARERFDAVLDATSPFAVTISHRTADACARLGIDYVQFLRRPWTPGAGDNWTFLNAETEAADHIPRGTRVLVSGGLRRLSAYENMTGRYLYVLVSEPTGRPFPFPNGRFVLGPVPSQTDAGALFLADLGVDWVVACNTGSSSDTPNIEAARRLGLPVAMVRRPPQPEGHRISTVAEALAWVRRRN